MKQQAQSGDIREELRALVDRIPESDMLTARKFLRALVDSLELALLNAPPDDEPLSDREHAATEEALLRERHRELLIPHREILREFDPEQKR